ncbi:hypothetical protein [Streptomyces sp. WZ-12]|uniref:hypothetical protein n=1 Tax=Streptomyces sp. WZ-12 TaxID=3030210 RepID=UPI0023818FE6|nr:hypothetical protein [Streptomyces sp. WZ-12]
MPSVLGLLEAREKKVREEVARLREEAERVQTALDAAQAALDRLSAARETVAEVMTELPADQDGVVRDAVPRSVVPNRSEGVGAEVLAPEYRQILSVLAAPDTADGLRVKPIAVRLGRETRRPASKGCARG